MKRNVITISVIISMLFSLCSCGNVKQLDLFEIKNDGVINYLIKTESRKSKETKKSNTYQALNYKEQKAIWFSYIDLADFLVYKDEESFKSHLTTAMKNIKNAGFNTVYFHVRAFGDAYYNSELFQKALSLNEKNYDPLKTAIEICHSLKLSIHAWINPYRCSNESIVSSADSNFRLSKLYNSNDKADILKTVDNDEHLWLNPARDEATKLICDGVKEIMTNYTVDGIHFDDYFYPTTNIDFDESDFVKSKYESLSNFRLSCVNEMVKSVYKTVKDNNNSVLFGISPQGNITNDYELQFADVNKWCKTDGYVDYIAPQVYYGYESTCPYDVTIDKWNTLVNNTKRQLVIGLAEYKVISEDEFINKEGIIALQIQDAKKLSNYGGIAIYNYKNLFNLSDERIKSEYTFIQKEIK